MVVGLKAQRWPIQSVRGAFVAGLRPMRPAKKSAGVQFRGSTNLATNSSTFVFSAPSSVFSGGKPGRVAICAFSFQGTSGPSGISSLTVNGKVVDAPLPALSLYSSDGTWIAFTAAVWFPLPKGGAVDVVVGLNTAPSAISAGGVNFYETLSASLAPDIFAVDGPIAQVRGQKNNLLIANGVASLGGANSKSIYGVEVHGDYTSSRVLVDGVVKNLPHAIAFKSDSASIANVRMRLLNWR